MSVDQLSDLHLVPTSPGSPLDPSRIEELWFKDGTLVLAAEGSLFRCTEQPVTSTNNLKTVFPRPASSSPRRNYARAATVQRAETGLLDEEHGVGIGTADDAALEEISRVHRLVSRRSWKGRSLLPPLLRERFELPLLCTPTGSHRMPGAFLRTLANHWQEAEAMVEIGESTERLSQQFEACGGGEEMNTVRAAAYESEIECKSTSGVLGEKFFGAFPAKTTFDIVAGVIRLSTKYDVASLRNRALTHLSSAFPLTRAEFPGSPSWQIPDHEWIRVVLFAREMSIEWILSIAFYRVAEKCTPAQLLHGIVVDGVPFNLMPQDKLTSIEYSLAIGRAAYAEVTQFLVSWGAPCYKPDKEHCLKIRLEACAMTTEELESLSVCHSCKGAMRVARQKSLDTLWAGLPKRFGPPGWEALRQMKKANLG
ncbi:hypothetical protein B0H13DRAFT_2285028 [Mycena leptocephala]|nr:hypothetical protein B0H13DRAFT_2285028 [Mycena leptocephala]